MNSSLTAVGKNIWPFTSLSLSLTHTLSHTHTHTQTNNAPYFTACDRSKKALKAHSLANLIITFLFPRLIQLGAWLVWWVRKEKKMLMY